MELIELIKIQCSNLLKLIYNSHGIEMYSEFINAPTYLITEFFKINKLKKTEITKFVFNLIQLFILINQLKKGT